MAFGGVGIFSGLNISGLFATLKQQQEVLNAPPQPVALDLSVLSLNAVQLAPPPDVHGPAVIPPWQLPSDPANESLDRRLAEIRGITSFIDTGAPQVAAAGDDVDSRTSFILFDALRKLETLALYAAEDATPDASLPRLDAQFQQGLQEVRDFIETAPTKELTFLTGDLVTKVEPEVDLGSDTYEFTGRAVATGTRDDPLPGLTGTETFTIAITKNGTTDNILIDLSQVSGPLSINNIVDFINQQIAAVPLLDSNGQPVLDSNGQPIPKFVTRLEVVSDEKYDHAIKVAGSSTETVSFLPQASTPTVFVAENRTDLRLDPAAPDAVLRRLQDVTGALDPFLETTIASTDADATAIAQAASPDAAPVSAETRVFAVATDSQGFVYTVGRAAGDFGSQRNTASGEDVFLTKLDTNGNVVFSRLLGTAKDASAFALAVDANDNVIVAGSTTDNLASGTVLSGTDSFIAKFDSQGALQFVQQLDTVADDAALDVTTTATGDIVVTGYTKGAVDAAHPGFGGRDVLALRFDGTTGARVDTAVIGTAGDERGSAVAIAPDGNVLVASREDGRLVLRRLDAANLSSVLETVDLGSIGLGGEIGAIRVVGNDVFVAGTTADSTFSGGGATVITGAQGGKDGFLVKLTDNAGTLSPATLTFFGTAEDDAINDIAVSGGKVFVAGNTRGNISGLGRRGPRDAFVARFDAGTLAFEEVERFGLALEEHDATAIAALDQGPDVLDLLGLPLGPVSRVEPRTLDVQTTARPGDFFEISINGRAPQKITLEAGDTLEDLAARINRLSFKNEIKATVTAGQLTIEALGTNQVDLIAGDEGKDLLAKFGVKPQRLLGATALFDLDNAGAKRPSDPIVPEVGGVFGLKLAQPLSLKDKTAARFSLQVIQDAIATVQRAFRSLTPDPLSLIRPGLESTVPPPEIAAQISEYTTALARLQSINLAGPVSLFL